MLCTFILKYFSGFAIENSSVLWRDFKQQQSTKQGGIASLKQRPWTKHYIRCYVISKFNFDNSTLQSIFIHHIPVSIPTQAN